MFPTYSMVDEDEGVTDKIEVEEKINLKVLHKA